MADTITAAAPCEAAECSECGAVFAPVKRPDRTCSRACSLARKNRRREEGLRSPDAGSPRPVPPPPSPPRVIPCDVCAAPFTARNSRGRYCSPACNAEGSRRRTLRRPSELTCTECGVTFRPVGQAVTCSQACSQARSRRYQCDYAARLRARTAANRAAAPAKPAPVIRSKVAAPGRKGNPIPMRGTPDRPAPPEEPPRIPAAVLPWQARVEAVADRDGADALHLALSLAWCEARQAEARKALRWLAGQTRERMQTL